QEWRSLVNDYARRQLEFRLEEQLPDRLTDSARVFGREKGVFPSDQRALYLCQPILEALAASVVDVAAPENDVLTSLGLPIDAEAKTNESGIGVESVQNPRGPHALRIQSERKPPPDTTLQGVVECVLPQE